MALGETVLWERAKKLELTGSPKIKLTKSNISKVEELLHEVYVASNPSPHDYYHRRDLVRVFNLIAKDIYGSCDDFPVVEAFGSFLMDMFTAKSDLDLSINFTDGAVDFPREKKISALRKVTNFLYNLQWKGHVFGVNPIMGAKVPIIKVTDRGTGIECDISVENKDGIAKSQIIHIISAIDERFQKLSFLMKGWANANDINSSKDRTLNSLSIILLVAFHLQTREPPILPPFSDLLKEGSDPAAAGKAVHNFLYYGQKNKESVAELFITLLSKLASVETLWPEGLCASTYNGCWISKKWGSRIGNISVEDFTDRSQNVARAVGVEQVKKIYKCIHSSLDHLSAFMDGRIQASKLSALLFGPEHVPNVEENNVVNHKRSFPFDDPAPSSPLDPVPTKKIRTRLDPVPTKKIRSMEGRDPWGGKNQKYHESSNNIPPVTELPPQWPPIVAPEFGYGPLSPPFVHPQHFSGLRPNPVEFQDPHNLNPMIPFPYVGPGHVQPVYNQNPSQGPVFYPYGHG